MSTQVTAKAHLFISPAEVTQCLPASLSPSPSHDFLSVFVLLSCVLIATHGSADMDNHQKFEQIVNKMAAKIFEVEEIVVEMRVEMTEKDREIEVMREEMREVIREKDSEMKVMREEMEEKDNKVKKQLDRLEARNTELTTKLREVDQKSPRDVPYVLTCAFVDTWTTPGATITYDYLTADFNNSDKPGGGDGELDITTGKFTALSPGYYTVTYSGGAIVDPGQRVYFRLVGAGLVGEGNEGEWRSYSDSAIGGTITDQGSRTVVSV